jgi:transposase InsO family protein
LIKKTHLKGSVRDSALELHSDNGSPMKGSSMLETLYSLGVVSSFSRPRVSNDNAYAESFLKRVNIDLIIRIKGFQK